MRFACTNDNGYILIGNNYNPPGGKAILKVDPDGFFQWQKNYASQIYYSSIVASPGGGYYITGGKTTQSDLLLFKIDDIGDSVWTRFYGDTAADAGSQIINTNDSGFAIIGYTDSYGAGGRDVFFIKTDSNGTASIKENNNIQSRLKIFPNPAAGNFQVQFTSSKKSTSKIEIYNVLGEKVFEKDIEVVPGENKISINFNGDNGIYFLKLCLDEKTFTRKFIFEKN